MLKIFSRIASNKIGNIFPLLTKTFKRMSKYETSALDKSVDGMPNENWSKESMQLFHQLNGLGSDWIRYKRDISVRPDGSRNLLSTDTSGNGVEYAFFYNVKLHCLKGVVQYGIFTAGPIGHVHGGLIATMLDTVMGNSVFYEGYKAVTANLNVDYIRAIPLKSTTLIEAKWERIEGRKVFLSGAIKTADGSQLFAKATSLFIMPKHAL